MVSDIQLFPFKIEFVKIEDVWVTFNLLLQKLPLYAPVIWFAIYASKRRSESQRLEQEYAHKEALSSSYGGFKQQIEELEEEDQKLLKKLLDSSIETISNNASKSLDKKHGDGMPIQNLMTTLLNEIKKLKE